jgi:hypothetical protein
MQLNSVRIRVSSGEGGACAVFVLGRTRAGTYRRLEPELVRARRDEPPGGWMKRLFTISIVL